MKEPLYKRIKRELKEKIDSGLYREGDRLPTEMELARTFKTSRQTVHKALRDLAMEGVVERFPRSGTFVRKPQEAKSSILDLGNIADEIEERGHRYSNRLISLERVKADEHVAQAMRLVRDQELYRSKIVHLENGIPVRYDIRYVLPSSAPGYIEQEFRHTTPGEYLKRHSPPERVENLIEAIMPDREMRRELEIGENEPCLKITRIVHSKGAVASYSRLHYPSSRYKLYSLFETKG